ncbi:DNA polymerase IV [Lysobacter sp. TY2-98]|uniref:DNA polymerase IV n=1 Tax=Lysobacter sp. TY2-98 TaxID=2290922 RepID=UPI000E2010A5|nr:DNA polymerase IV [Lysobacter sp. TY2-98]AXK73176.1 DNA polymerase IV [Lysobacter sp. TY2-98]
MTLRKVIHVDMDAFYASVEQRDDPALRGRPVVVAWKGARSVVCAASYEARVFGIRSAMPAVRAERLCPDAVFVPPDFVRYKQVSQQIRAIFARHTPLVEPLSLDEAYLDVTNPLTALPTATDIAKDIRAAIREETHLTASAGVAPNKFVAKIASDWNKPDGLFVVPPSKVEAFLAPLPVGRLPGVGKVTQGELEALGLKTVTDLRDAGRDVLMERFGRWGRRLFELSWGIDEHPVEPERPHTQISSEDTLETDLPLDDLAPHIARMAERTWAAWQRQRERDERENRAPRRPRTVVLKLKTSDFRILTRSLTPSRMPGDAEAFARTAVELRTRVSLPASTRYRLIGVGLANLDVADPQVDLFGDGLPL